MRFDQQMDVVRHEAVRNDCEASIGRGSHYLLQDYLNVFAHDEADAAHL